LIQTKELQENGCGDVRAEQMGLLAGKMSAALKLSGKSCSQALSDLFGVQAPLCQPAADYDEDVVDFALAMRTVLLVGELGDDATDAAGAGAYRSIGKARADLELSIEVLADHKNDGSVFGVTLHKHPKGRQILDRADEFKKVAGKIEDFGSVLGPLPFIGFLVFFLLSDSSWLVGVLKPACTRSSRLANADACCVLM